MVKKPDEKLSGSRTLTEVINNLRAELLELKKDPKKEDLTFQIQDVEVELNVVLTMEAGGTIGFNCWLYQAAGTGKATQQSTHKVKLKLTPMLKSDDPKNPGPNTPMSVSGGLTTPK